MGQKNSQPVGDPDLQIREGGGGAVIQTLREGGTGLIKFFRPFGPQFGLKIRGEGRAPPLDPPLRNVPQ